MIHLCDERFHLLQDFQAVNDEKEFSGVFALVVCRFRNFREVIKMLEEPCLELVHWTPLEMKHDLCVVCEREDQNAVAVYDFNNG